MKRAILETKPEKLESINAEIIDAIFVFLCKRRYTEAKYWMNLLNIDFSMVVTTDQYKSSMLSYASSFCQGEEGISVLEFLLNKGCSIDHQSTDGITALMWASMDSNNTSSLDAVRFLVSKGASLDIQEREGWTALTYAIDKAVDRNRSSIETVKFLIDHGAAVNLRDDQGNTPISLASKMSNDARSLEIVKYLIQNGAAINVQSNSGYTPLMLASRWSGKKSSLEIVKFLIENGANLHLCNDKGETALDCCANAVGNADSNFETVCYLVEKGCLFNSALYRGTDLKTTAHLKHYPFHHLKTLLARLREEAVLLMRNKGIEEFVRLKMDTENDALYDSLFDLPYHRVEAGISKFLEKMHTEAFYDESAWNAMSSDLESVQKQIQLTLEAIARAIHLSSEGREEVERLSEEQIQKVRLRIKRTRE